MRGIQYLIDDTGSKKAVLIDLKAWGKLWEDFQDAMVSEARKDEPTVSWDALKTELEHEHVQSV